MPVEGWRLIAGGLLVLSGFVLMLLTMARVRERKGATGGDVAIAGAISLVVLAILTLLVLLVLPPVVAWVIAGAAAGSVAVMLLAS